MKRPKTACRVTVNYKTADEDQRSAVVSRKLAAVINLTENLMISGDDKSWK